MRNLYAFLTVLLLAACSLAQAASHAETATIAFINDNGSLNAPVQAAFEPIALPLLTAGTLINFQPLNSVLATSKVPDSDRTTLLGYPELLVASSGAPSLLDTQYLVVAEITPMGHPRIISDLIDITHHEKYQMPEVQGKDNADLFTRLAAALKKRTDRIKERRGMTVVGNPDSHLYHKPDADHSNLSKGVHFTDEASARQAGYSPCPICFPEENPLVRNNQDLQNLGMFMAQVMKYQFPVIVRNPDSDTLIKIADKLCAANHLGTDPMDFYWINSDDMFSVSYYGGETYLSTGIMRLLEGDEVAALIAHELAHLERNHFLQYYHKAYEQFGPPPILRFESRQAYADFLLRLNTRLLHDGFPLAMEEEADTYAIQYLVKAGYPADLYARTLHKIQEKVAMMKTKKSAWTRVHPLPPERFARLAEIPKQLADIAELAHTVAATDPGEGEALERHAVQYSDSLAQVKQFTTVLTRSEAGIKIEPAQGGDPELRY
ncbi:MAG: M48 family metallopeptidase [Candidatus Xenobia bacterium]